MVITESHLRSQLRNKTIKSYEITPGTLLTPSAREYLKSKNIEVVTKKEIKQEDIKEDKSQEKKKEFIPRYICAYSGGRFDKKPEYLTQLYGNKLVYKDHPRIILRGKLDSLQSKILEVQDLVHQKQISRLVKDLDEALQYVRDILRAEVIEENIETQLLFGLEEDVLRKMSHNPKEYFKIPHILPNYKMGAIAIGLNTIRTSVRETELAAIIAFKNETEVERQDILKGLNRLSSAIYVLMCRYLSGYYK